MTANSQRKTTYILTSRISNDRFIDDDVSDEQTNGVFIHVRGEFQRKNECENVFYTREDIFRV